MLSEVESRTQGSRPKPRPRTSSVARGRGALACEVCNIARFLCFWGRFLVENWKQPLQRKLGSEVGKYMSWFGLKKRLNFRFRPKNQPQFRWRPFFFFFFLEITWFWAEKTFEFPISTEKSVSISVKTLFSFFLEITWFWAEKTFEFPSFPRNSVSIFGQTAWFWFKNKENSGQGRLHFFHYFKKAPLFSNPGYAPAKDTKKFRSQGQRQTLSRPRPRTKDTGASILQKNKVFKKIFKQSEKKGLQKNFSGEKGLQKFFFRRFPLEENKKRSTQIYC